MHVESKFSKQILPTSGLCFQWLCYFRKQILRGALTNGHEWIFLLLKLNNNHDGASYWQSNVVKFTPGSTHDGQLILGDWPDLIAGILSHWVNFDSNLCD